MSQVEPGTEGLPRGSAGRMAVSGTICKKVRVASTAPYPFPSIFCLPRFLYPSPPSLSNLQCGLEGHNARDCFYRKGQDLESQKMLESSSESDHDHSSDRESKKRRRRKKGKDSDSDSSGDGEGGYAGMSIAEIKVRHLC